MDLGSVTSRKKKYRRSSEPGFERKETREGEREGCRRRGNAQGRLSRFVRATPRGLAVRGETGFGSRPGAWGRSGASALGSYSEGGEDGALGTTRFWRISPGEVGSPNSGATSSALTTGHPPVNRAPGK